MSKCQSCNGAGGEEVPTSTNCVWRPCPVCSPKGMSVPGVCMELPKPKPAFTDEYARGVRDAARIASQFSIKHDRSLIPSVKWDDMAEPAKIAAHSTAQTISMDIMQLIGE